MLGVLLAFNFYEGFHGNKVPLESEGSDVAWKTPGCLATVTRKGDVLEWERVQ